jgi:transposase-like protein
MDVHENARLTPKSREEMVRAVVEADLSKAATARRFNTTAKTVAKWVDRFRKLGSRPATVSRVLRRLGVNKLAALESSEPVRHLRT